MKVKIKQPSDLSDNIWLNMVNKYRHRIQDHHPPPHDRHDLIVLQTKICRPKFCGKVLSFERIRQLIFVMLNPTNCNLLISIVFIALSFLSSISQVSAAFGDRIVPLSSSAASLTSTLSPFYNYKKSHPLRAPSTSTTEADIDSVTFPSFDDASPDPENERSNNDQEPLADSSDLNRTVSNDPILHDHYNDDNENEDDDDEEDDDWSYDDGYPYNYLYDFDPTELNDPSFFADNDTYGYLNTSSSEIVPYNYTNPMDVEFEDEEENSYNMYPLEPPKLNEAYVNTSGNESISSSGTYSQFRYAPAPYINPFDPTHQMKKVVFINPVDPKPGHHHTPLNVHKIYSGISSHIPGMHGRGGGGHYMPGPPIYRDSGPRIKYVPAGMKHPHRLPAHYHIKKYPSGKLGPIHSHEYHHHPMKDSSYYGYIPGIPGRPWKDYPMYSHVPRTGFHCKLVKYPGFYADMEAGCQVWLHKTLRYTQLSNF